MFSLSENKDGVSGVGVMVDEELSVKVVDMRWMSYILRNEFDMYV